MKESAFARSDAGTPDAGEPFPWPAALVLAAAFFAAHLPFLSPSLEDIDSINFALGLRDFDPALHQPHPPGSPVYVALGKAALAIVSVAWPSLPRLDAEALVLALWSAAAGVIAIIAAAGVFTELHGRLDRQARATALWATAILAAAPLFWMSGLRPMSDMPGIAAALSAQALLLRGRTDRRRLVQGAVVSALAAGIRVQTVWLTMPLLLLVLFEQRRAGIGWLLSRPVAALGAAGLAWLVPLVAVSGGVDAYLGALGNQAGEDFARVNMLWLDPSPHRLAMSLYETFVMPWGSNVLAAVVACAAVSGGAIVLVRERSVLALLVAMVVPYTVFHLLFQETATVRYALPTLPVVAWLAARGLAWSPRFAALTSAPVLASALIVAIPAGVAYGSEVHPAFRAVADAGRRAGTDPPAAVFSHYSLRRALQADAAELPFVEPRRQYEWLGPADYWRAGGPGPVWFFADPLRTDLALIDPRAREDVDRYRWSVADRPELGGIRPAGVDWYRFRPPGWFAGEGWSLTPETGGLARSTAAGPDAGPIQAWVRRRPGPMHLVVGGRHLGEPGDPASAFELAIDGAIRDQWDLTVDERNFLRFLDLPDGIPGGAGEEAYALLTIVARGTSQEPRPAVAVRQFDIRAAPELIYGFGEGWHEEEFEPATGRRWRWTSDRSILRLQGRVRSVRITMRGESPLRYFDAAPIVRVTAGGRVIDQIRPEADFDWTVTVPWEDIERGDGTIAVETDRVYLPGPAEGTADQRRLGLRVFEFHVVAEAF